MSARDHEAKIPRDEGHEDEEELPSGVVRVEFHDDPWAYDSPENRRRQMEFRRWARFDEISRAEPRSTTPKPDQWFVTREVGNFPHGGTAQVRQIFDEAGQPTTEVRAHSTLTLEFDDQNRLVWRDVSTVVGGKKKPPSKTSARKEPTKRAAGKKSTKKKPTKKASEPRPGAQRRRRDPG